MTARRTGRLSPRRIRWSRVLPPAALVATALGLSVALMPEADDLGLLDIEAGRVENAVSRLERAAAEGTRLASTVATLARARAELGDVEGAVRDLEGLRQSRPDDTALLQALADHYEGLGRYPPLVSVLLRMQELAPEPQRQRRVVQVFGELQDDARQRRALSDLLQSGQGRFNEYLQLAHAEAAAGHPAEAARVLRALNEQFTVRNRIDIVAFDIALLLASQQDRAALERAGAWLAARRDVALSARQLAEVFVAQTRPDLAVTMLRRVSRGQNREPQLMAAIAQAEQAAGNEDAALAILDDLERAGDGPGGTPLMRLQLAIALDSPPHMVAAAGSLAPASLSAAQIGPVISAAMRIGARQPLSQIVALPPARLKAVDPIVLAEAHLMLRDPDTARRWSDRAARSIDGNMERALYLADVELRLRRRSRALDALALVVPDAEASRSEASPAAPLQRALPAHLIDDLAYLYIRAGQQRHGRAVLTALRDRQPSPEADDAWALAALAAGRTAAVSTWFAGVADERPWNAAFLKDIAHLAMGAEAYALAADAARRLVDMRGLDGDRILLAQTLLAANRPWTSAAMTPIE
jgi:predicted Zn-dependent protease